MEDIIIGLVVFYESHDLSHVESNCNSEFTASIKRFGDSHSKVHLYHPHRKQ